MTNYLYCEYMAGKQNPQIMKKAQKRLDQWKALLPNLGGEPHKRRLLRLEKALR